MSVISSQLLQEVFKKHTAVDLPEIRPGIVRIDTGVLVPLLQAPTLAVVMTERSHLLRSHAGEICFPGGKPEENDRDLEHTALREAHEEIGLSMEGTTALGKLSSVPTATSRYRLFPYARLISRPENGWQLSSEVHRVLELPIHDFFNGTIVFALAPVRWKDVDTLAPFFALQDGRAIFGATAYVLVELCGVIGDALSQTLPEPVMVSDPPWLTKLLASLS